MRSLITKKIPISEEEKRQRVRDYNEFEGANVDEEEFVKREIFDEYVELICLKCGHKDEIEYDLLLEMFEFDDIDIPELECPFCRGGTVIPIQFLDEHKRKNHK